MANRDFQERLQRIGASSEQTHHNFAEDGPQGEPPRRAGINYRLLFIGAALMALGMQAVRYANENYDAIRDGGGIGMAAGLGLGGFAALLTGIILLFRAIFSRRDASGVGQGPRQASGGARVFFSLVGFAAGTLASLYMFMAAAARFVGTEKADQFAGGGMFIALALAVVALLFGLLALFLRGYALGRVPLYFVAGAVMTYAFVRLMKINMLEWPQFAAMLQ